jgi:hypothetical protein
MIYCIWYPSGGFGHFINAVLTLHGVDFQRPSQKEYVFSESGDSHNLKLSAPKYFHNPKEYKFEFDKKFHYSVLIDNGINDESTRFVDFFPNASIIKVCYSDYSWPVVAATMIEKAMKKDLSQEIKPSVGWTDKTENWAVREKYFLFLRDHSLRFLWEADDNYYHIDISNLFDYRSFKACLQDLGVETTEFETLWNDWNTANQKFLGPIRISLDIINNVKNKNYIDISYITDIWTQAVVYYFIWVEYGVEVPHNTYANWFTNIKDIVTMLKDNGVVVD